MQVWKVPSSFLTLAKSKLYECEKYQDLSMVWSTCHLLVIIPPPQKWILSPVKGEVITVLN
jgi:hypothetical protein